MMFLPLCVHIPKGCARAHSNFEVTMAAEKEQLQQYAGEVLPDLTVELLAAYSTQSSEIHTKRELLSSLQAGLEKVQEQLLSTSREVCGSVRTICLKEELLVELERDCCDLEEEVSKLLEELRKEEANLLRKKKERETDEEVRNRYQQKMDACQAKMKDIDQFSPVQLELKALKEKIDSLKEKSINTQSLCYYSHTYHSKGPAISRKIWHRC